MIKKIIGAILIILALICIGTTIYEFLAAKGEMRIWSADVLGAAGFHGVCMIIASFLLARPAVKEEHKGKEE